MATDFYYTTTQAAKLCGVHPVTIVNVIDSGQLKCIQTPGGHRRISGKALAHFRAKLLLPEYRPREAASLVLLALPSLLSEEVERLLKEQGREVSICRPEEAWDSLGRLDPDCLVIDGDALPRGEEGREKLCRGWKVRFNPDLEDRVVVVLVSRAWRKYEALDWLEAGADDCLVKPVAALEMVSRIERLLSPHGAKEAAGVGR